MKKCLPACLVLALTVTLQVSAGSNVWVKNCANEDVKIRASHKHDKTIMSGPKNLGRGEQHLSSCDQNYGCYVYYKFENKSWTKAKDRKLQDGAPNEFDNKAVCINGFENVTLARKPRYCC